MWQHYLRYKNDDYWPIILIYSYDVRVKDIPTIMSSSYFLHSTYFIYFRASRSYHIDKCCVILQNYLNANNLYINWMLEKLECFHCSNVAENRFFWTFWKSKFKVICSPSLARYVDILTQTMSWDSPSQEASDGRKLSQSGLSGSGVLHCSWLCQRLPLSHATHPIGS